MKDTTRRGTPVIKDRYDTVKGPSAEFGPGRCPVCNERTILSSDIEGSMYRCIRFPRCFGVRRLLDE